MEHLHHPVFHAWMGSWKAKGYKIVAVDTTTEVSTGEEIGAAKEIFEKMIKKSVIKSKSWMPESPPCDTFVLFLCLILRKLHSLKVECELCEKYFC